MGFRYGGSTTNSKNKGGGFRYSGDKSKITYVPLTLTDGKQFGEISYGAYMAIENNTLDSYKPKDDKEKSVLDEYKKYVKEQQEKQAPKTPEITDEEQNVFAKYGFNPTTFNKNDFESWAKEHNFEYRMAGNDLTGVEYKWLPKRKSDLMFWKTLTTDEEEADKEVLERYLEKKAVQANAKKYPTLTSVATVATAPIRGIAGVVATGKNAVELALGKDITTNDTAHSIVEDANLIRETVTNEHASKWFDGASGKLGNYGALTYNGLMSIGDTVMTSLTTRGIGSGLGLTGKGLATFTSNITSGLLASNSASSTIIKKKNEGMSDGKAVANGIATGLAEFITEKISLDMIFKSPTSMLKKGVIGFFAEGSEEMASDIISKTADYFISGNDSDIKKNISKYMQNGMSKKDATYQATWDSIYETLSAGLVGGLSGVAVSSAYHGFGKSEIKKLGADYRVVAEDVIQSGLESPKNTTAYKHANKLAKKGINNISDYELGLQHTYNVEQIDFENKQAEKATKQSRNNQDVIETAPTTVSVGDVFQDTKYGGTIEVVGRDDTHTVVTINTGTTTERKIFENSQADHLATSEQYEKIRSGDTTTTAAIDDQVPSVENPTVVENETVDVPVNTETSSDTMAIAENATTTPATETTPTDSETKTISLRRVGDSYELYGNDALALAEELDMETTRKVVNGVKTDVLTIPENLAMGIAEAMADDGYSFAFSDKPSVSATSTTEAENEVVTDETKTMEETTSSEEESVTEDKISVVSDAISDTLTPQAKEDLQNGEIKNDYSRIAQTLIDVYEGQGSLEGFETFFVDGGKKVIEAIEGKTDTTTTEVKSNAEETHDNATETHDNATETHDNATETNVDKSDGATTEDKRVKTDELDKSSKTEKLANDLDNEVEDTKALKNERESDTIDSTKESNPVEREGNGNESVREDLLHGNGKRRGNESTRKQTERFLSFRRKNQGKDGAERQRLARELIEQGQVEEVIDGNHKYKLVNKDAYNDDMLSMVKEAKRHGVELMFCVGEMTTEVELDDGTKVTKNIRGLKISPTQILVRYDANRTPQQIFKHEYVHAKYKTPAMQKIKNFILGSLSEEKKQDILSQERYAGYAEVYRNNKEKVWEEFVCDVMAGMNDYTSDYIDTVNDYWYGNETVDNYKASEYTESIDAGGNETSDGRYDVDDSYTENEYRRFGWVRANDILSSGEYSNFTAKFADAVENKFYFPKSKDGEFVIAVSDINEPVFRGTENVLVFAEGKIDNLVINSIIRIYEYDEAILEKVRGYIYGLEHRGIHVESRKAFTRYYGSDFADGYYRRNSKNSGHNNVNGVGNGNSAKTQTTQEEGVKYDLDNTDSKGKTLSEAQQEYFKDSKVRDENGNLLVVYHGTRNKDFTVFNRNHNYYTDNRAMAESYAPSGALYEGYLNITNPYIIDASGAKWSAIPVSDKVKKMLDEAGSSTFKEKGKWCTSVADIVAAISDMVDEGEADYDGVIVRNVDDTGSYYKGSNKNSGTDYITFKSEQFKNTDNTNPTTDPDIRFDLDEPVEETKDLIAVHNLSSEKLLKTLKLGGLPMPSIAITRAKEGYNNFGAISLVFGKETIDPQFMRANHVYSGDAWTPTYPHIEYKLNTKAQESIKKKIDALVPSKVRDDLGGLHLDSNNMENELNRHGDMVTSYRYNYAMKYAFLVDKGIDIELPTKDEPLYRYGEVSNDAVISFAHKMVDGLKTVNSLLEQHSSKLMEDTELINGIASVLNEDVLSSVEENSERHQMLIENPLFKAEDIDLSTVLGMLEAARKYFYKNGKIDSKVDYREAKTLIDEKVNMAEYESWLKDLFSDVVAKEGIRNNKDLYTPSGNRRSFEALHYEHTLENVIKAMKEEGTKGIGGFGGGNIFGAATMEYSSIDDVKSDAENRMQTLPESKYDEIKKGFSDRLFELANSLPIHKDSFSALDDAANMLIEAVSKFKTKSGMANYLRTESKGWANYSDHIVDDLVELVNDIRNMPVAYFEAKPQRAVGYDEIKAVIMPAQESYEDDLSEVKSELEKLNVPILEYEYGDNNARIKALNSLEDVRFDLSESDTLKTQKKIEDVAQSITHDELIALAKKNTQEFVDKVKENKSLQKRLKNAKRQMLVSPNPVVNVAQAGKVTKDILKEMDSTLKAKDLQEDIISIYTEHAQAIKKAGGVESKVQEANDTMVRRFATLAVDIADNAETFVESEMYSSIKSYVKETRIKVPDDAKNDMHYAEFRKSHMGTFNLTNDGLDIDIAYQELCDMFPGIFDAEISNPADQLLAIADKLDALKPYAYNPHSGYMQDAIDHIVYRFVSEADGIAASPKTKAQKMAEKAKVDKDLALYKERENFERKLDKHKATSERNIQKLQKKLDDFKYVQYWEKRLFKEEKALALKDAKAHTAEVKNRAKEEKARAIKAMRDRQKTAVLKSKIRNIVSDMKKKLDKNEKTGGYPKELVKTVAEVCSALDFHTDRTSKDGSPTKVSLKLDALKMEYDALKNNENYDFASEYREEVSDKIGELYQTVKDKRVVDLNLAELSELKDILSEINHSLSIATKQIGNENAKANAELAWGIIESLEANSDLNDLDKRLFMRENKLGMQSIKATILNPHRINEMIAGYDHDSVWWKLHDAINRGNRKTAKFVMEANKPFDELTDGGGNEIAFYDFRTKKIKTGIKYIDGSEVEIPKSIICEMVMMWNRKDGKTHLETGGATIPDIELYNKGKTTDAIKGGKRTKPITANDIVRLKGLLDSYDMAWIDRAHSLFNKVSKDAINSTSMELVGRELAKTENYIRMYVNQDFVGKEVGKDQDNNITLEGHGSLKETKPKAKQPLLFRGLHENVYDNIEFVSKYYGLAIPIRNFNKVYRMTFRDDNGQSSVKEVIGKKFGAAIQNNVVEQYIKELQSPRKREHIAFDKIKGNWLGATFWGNISSALKQTSSYWTGSALLGEDALAKGLKNFAKNAKQTKAEINKYSGTLYKRSQGFSTTELGDRANRKRLAGASNKVTKFVNEKLPILKKVPQGLRPGNWLQAMDVNTSAALWEACKVEVSKTMKASDEGYMQAVTDLWERVIEETQSNYDVIHRPESLKRTDVISQTITMFTTDAQQKFGLLFSAYNDFATKSELYKKGGSAADELAKDVAKKRLYKASRSIAYSALWMGLVSVLGNMLLRKFKSYIDDEEKDVTAGSVAKQYMLFVGEDLFNTIMPVGSSLILQAADTFNNGYDFASVPTFDVIEDFIVSLSKIYKAATDDGDVLGALADSTYAISNITGVPVKNISDIVKSIKGYAGDIKELDFAHDITDYASGNKSFYSYGDLASSICSGDTEKETKVLDYYSENGKEFNKGSLTREIKPAYVQMYVDSPEKAAGIKRKLISDYEYDSKAIGEWAIEVYLDNILTDPEYAEEIKESFQSHSAWKNATFKKVAESYYKSVYKEGKEKDIEDLRNALISDAKISSVTLSAWEREADKQIREKEKDKYR